jgi:uncharacterized protein (UPF0332 family)
MTGLDFVHLAKQLAAGSTEAEWRSAVSRAYYGAFHVARQLMTELGFAVARADRAHSYLSRRLLAASIPQVKQAGSDLNTLRGNRNEADYDLHRAITQTAAGLHVRMAEQIVQFLNTSRQEPTRTQVTDAMKVYERDVLQEVTWHP